MITFYLICFTFQIDFKYKISYLFHILTHNIILLDRIVPKTLQTNILFILKVSHKIFHSKQFSLPPLLNIQLIAHDIDMSLLLLFWSPRTFIWVHFFPNPLCKYFSIKFLLFFWWRSTISFIFIRFFLFLCSKEHGGSEGVGVQWLDLENSCRCSASLSWNAISRLQDAESSI